ncbi:MAG: hypothetical protein J6U53_01915 [Tidjanibacter sp.]|nr:hypothetical protein [Tidjanibacter sp.]
MKKLLKVFCAVAMGALALYSCDDPIGGEGPDEPNTPGGNEIVIAEGPEAIMRPDLITAVNYVPDKVEAGEEGVSVYVTGKATNNFKFLVRPGAMVQSYRLDVYPLCRLYNSLYETAKNQRLEFPLSQKTVETLIRGFIFDASGAGAYTFSTNNMEDFLSHEFDWMNTPYAQAKVVPNCEYVVAVVGCFDTEGAEQGDLTLCYIRTPYEELVGNPEVKIEVNAGYTQGYLRYSPANADTKFYYQWCSDENDLQPYIDAYGDKLYIDFMRNAIYDPTIADAPEVDENGMYNHLHTIKFGQTADPNHTFMATAVGLDMNYTPSPEFQSLLFHPAERPADAEPADVEITVDESKVAASLFWVDCYMPAGCGNAYMSLIEAEDAAEIMQYNEEQMKAYAMEIYALTAGNCWGFTNWNYVKGGSYRAKEVLTIGKPDTEYYIAYTGMNQYMELSPVKFVGPFRTKPLGTTTPEQSEEDAVLTLSPEDVNKLVLDFTYSFEKTAAIHFQYIYGFGDKVVMDDGSVKWVAYGQDGEIVFEYPTEQSPREELLDHIYFDPYANRWSTEPSGHMAWTDVLQPESRFGIAYVAEDWNGVFGEVKFAYAETGKLEGGNNPEVEITGRFDAEGNPYFHIEQVKDCWATYYMSDNSENPTLKLSKLGNRNHFRNEAAVLEAWYNYCLEYSLGTSYANPVDIDIRSDFEVVLCIPLGGSPDNAILGEMEYLIYKYEQNEESGEYEHKWYKLDHWYPNSVAPLMSAGYQEPLSLRKIKPEARPEVGDVRPVGKSTIIELDYDKFSAHPKATGR